MNMTVHHHKKPAHKEANGADKWAGEWVINEADSNALRNVLLVKNGITRFKLVQAKIEDQVVYKVSYNTGEMTDAWSDTSVLYLRGEDQAKLPGNGQAHPMPSHLPLPRWKQGDSDNYLEVAKAVTSVYTALPSTERLEGDIHVGGKAEAITLYRVDGAISEGSFLVISVASDPGAQVRGNESGIAHGNS
jgi:hypothetical protein